MPAGTEFVSLKMSISRAFLSSLEREAICEMMRERQTNTHQFIYEGSPPFTDVVSETEERSGDLSDTSPSLLETPKKKWISLFGISIFSKRQAIHLLFSGYQEIF